jgi:uncharacterized membrane protein YedE/YeeE
LHSLAQAWPWWVAGPLLGLTVPLLLVVGNRQLGVSGSLRAMCAAVAPCGIQHFTYDWRRSGLWNILFVTGVLAGGWVAAHLIGVPDVAIAVKTKADLAALGLRDQHGLVPRELFTWSALTTVRGLIVLVVGGFAVGFGTSYAGGCTSGHGLSGLANFEKASLLACATFFATGIVVSLFVLPWIL